MIRFRGLPALLAAGLVMAAQPSSAEIKIGYIDSEILRERMEEFKDIQRQLDRLTQGYQQEAMDRESRLVKMREDFRKQELLMSDARKAEMAAEFEQAVQDLQQFTQQKLGPDGEVFQKNIELSKPIFERVNEALKKLAEEEGFDFIFDVAGGGGIVYADPDRYNLTEKLLALLAEEREEESSP
ncbi:MAG: OmpH family outer membrane protein [Gemmatimonadaceae bacterium]|nr:OmpH family outer membrane protein [Gemmatimonadaceae bacterium]